MAQPNWLEILYSALASPYGLAIAVSDADACRQALYRARTSSGDPALDGLQIRLRNEGELWIVKGVSNAAERKRTA